MDTPRMRRASALLGAVLAALFVVLTVLVGLRFGPLLELDQVVARRAHDSTLGHGIRTACWEWLTTWGGPSILRIAMLLGAVALAAYRRRSLALWLAGLTVVEGVVAPLAKQVLARPRPHWTEPILGASSTSFPSGHATAAFTTAVAGLLLARRVGCGRLTRSVLPALGLVAAAAVAASRVFLGVHYLSDVVGGALLGTTLALTTYTLSSWVAPVETVRRAPPSR